jgi:hypothetical protein
VTTRRPGSGAQGAEHFVQLRLAGRAIMEIAVFRSPPAVLLSHIYEAVTVHCPGSNIITGEM